MAPSSLLLIYLIYGLAFIAMGLIVAVERNRAADTRLRHALRPLVVFGLSHGAHEWFEIFELLGLLPAQAALGVVWTGFRIALLALSFFSLTAFGASMLSPNERIRRLSLLATLVQAAFWGYGLLSFSGRYVLEENLLVVADVWSRYVLAIPGALFACAGLVAQQRAFRLAGMERFSRDSLWAALAFSWYGLIGQVFTKASPLPPSNVLNQALFISWFGFPVQLLRAFTAVIVAVFVARFLRSFEVETRRKLAELQAQQLYEARQRETRRGVLLRRVVAAQEAERQRIARELHDETGQSLTAIAMGLRGVTGMIRQDVDRAASHLRQLEGMAVKSLDELRRLIADLRPSHLDDLGLSAALRWYAGQVQERSDVRVDLDIPADEDCNLPLVISTALFRIAQEALTNVLKHAKANYIWVCLWRDENDVHLEIRDNGVGFDPDQFVDSGLPTWGLLGMQERATLLGGSFALESSPGQGTQVIVSVPCHREMEEEHEEDQTVVG